MRSFMVLVFITCAFQAEAGILDGIDFELGTGVSYYQKQPNGIWYQEGFPYALELQSTPASIGISKQIGTLRYRIEYLSLGNVSSNAVATDDQKYTKNYTLTCGNKCQLNKFHGIGDVSGVVLSVSKELNPLNIPLYVEAGVYAYSPKWRVEVYSIPPSDVQLLGTYVHEPKLEVGPMLGFGFRHSGVDIGVRYLHAEASSGDLPAVYKGSYTLMFKAYF